MSNDEATAIRSAQQLFDQVRLLFHELTRTADRLHADEPVAVGTRAVLEWLLRHGPGTVPQIARSRSVTRQHIQPHVNTLAERGLVTLEPNPAHQRSALVRLTNDGDQLIRRILRREEQHLAAVLPPLRAEELKNAARVLETVRHAIGGSDVQAS